MTQEGAIELAQLVYLEHVSCGHEARPRDHETNHLRYPRDIVVATAYKTKESFPRILIQNTNSSKLGGLLLEIWVDF